MVLYVDISLKSLSTVRNHNSGDSDISLLILGFLRMLNSHKVNVRAT